MHMADALVSPAVGGTMWAASVGLAAYSARKIAPAVAERKAPLMGVLGAFVFAAQMINFTIPATGSSGHLAGGMLLAVLVGPYAAFLVMFSILGVQALFFADGGLLALGCNVFNMSFWPCFVAYPLIFRPLAGPRPGRARLMTASVLGGVAALQLGAFGVVVQTWLSGISSLPFGTFLLLMQPIHLAIGLVEGIVTAVLVAFVWQARPEILELPSDGPAPTRSLRPIIIGFVAAGLLTGVVLSWFASAHPDGLEWSMFRTTGQEELAAPAGGVHESLAKVQESTAFLPDYGFKAPDDAAAADETADEPWPAVSVGTSVSGLVGGALVLVLAGLAVLALKGLRRGAVAG